MPLSDHTPEAMQFGSWLEFLAYVSPPAVALLYATARWVELRARITSEVERSISRERELQSEQESGSPEETG